MNLPRDEMAFRKAYEPLVLNRSLLTVFRPGVRLYPQRRGYKQGEIITGRIIERVGSDVLGLPPQFNDKKMRLRIDSIAPVSFDDLGPDAFFGSTPDVQCRDDLERQLQNIYGQPIDAFDRMVTRIGLSYLS